MKIGVILGVISHLAMSSFVIAPTATAVIRGSVQDVTGAALVGIHVTLLNEARNQSRDKLLAGKAFSSSGHWHSAIIG